MKKPVHQTVFFDSLPNDVRSAVLNARGRPVAIDVPPHVHEPRVVWVNGAEVKRCWICGRKFER